MKRENNFKKYFLLLDMISHKNVNLKRNPIVKQNQKLNYCINKINLRIIILKMLKIMNLKNN